jgi:hypothetical protein
VVRALTRTTLVVGLVHSKIFSGIAGWKPVLRAGYIALKGIFRSFYSSSLLGLRYSQMSKLHIILFTIKLDVLLQITSYT